MIQKLNIFGINFISSSYSTFISILKKGALMVVPAAPALANINKDKNYHQALKDADFAILDSGFLVLLLKIFQKRNVEKFSGYLFLEKFLNDDIIKAKNSIFLVNPSKESSIKNYNFLKKSNFKIEHDDQYIAPFYKKDEIVDYQLIEILEQKKPDFVLINLGGGVQEVLGSFLKKKLSFTPGIICTGAAISFFTGEQAPVSKIIDKFYLGWLWRCFDDPKKFVPRYLGGFKLIPIFIKHLYIKKEKK
tara:strand:- start:1872 stop:2615 length:744 start_codon:yes stop_codon:yes gene_type:complete